VGELEPFYPKGEGRGRPPIGLEKMLRMYIAQQCFGFSDEAIEDASYDSQAIRRFVRMDLRRESAPDATTLLKFRRLLEKHKLTASIFETINKHWLKQDDACKRIAEIPGVGPLTATAAVAMMGDPKAFKSGREFAAFAGLVPRQVGTGGRVKLLGISKRGDTYLRTLLIHGARSVLTHAKDPGPWVTELRRRRPLNVAIVALANKMARTIWAVLAHERTYQKGFVSRPV